MVPVQRFPDGSRILGFLLRPKGNSGSIVSVSVSISDGSVHTIKGPRVNGWATGIRLSPDAKYVAYDLPAGNGSARRDIFAVEIDSYCSYPEPSRQPHVIRIRSLATGQEREFLHKLPMVRSLCWSPDGRFLLASRLTVYEGDPNLARDVFRVDVSTGESTRLLRTRKGNVWQAECSPDENTVYYSGAVTGTERDFVGVVVRRRIDTGEEKNIFEFPSKVRGAGPAWALSPNGKFIAAGFSAQTGKKEEYLTKIVMILSEGGQSTELLRSNKPTGELSALAWSRDGKTVLFTIQRDFDAIEFWQVPAAGGQPRKITEANLGWCYSLRVHPDGQRIAFMAGKRHHELWVMEHFLPPGTAAKQSE